RDHAVAGIVIFLFLNLTLYSSFFTNPTGVIDAVRSPWRWTMRSGSEHVKSFWYYGAILIKLELPLLLAALTGGLLILRRGARFHLFVGAWACGNLLAYSMIGYKTPWLIINMLIPMALLGGHAVQRTFDRVSSPGLRLIALLAVLALLASFAHLTREVNLSHYDDNRNLVGFFSEYGRELGLPLYRDELVGYVYAQTDRDLGNLLKLIEKESSATAKKPAIYVASPDYWPLPWYLRDYDRIDFSGRRPMFEPDGNPGIGHQIIIARNDQLGDFANATGFRVSPTSYNLRPGVLLVLLVRENSTSESETNQ
ncbi:MAG: hypothetical protein EBZ36_11910, partial [Acidobacteria bacterium]|nr:hypothetical protein [Acidobacteriota bacterium]